MVGKQQISLSEESNVERVVKDRGKERKHTGNTGTGEDVQGGGYRNQHNFITYTSEIENAIVTIQILSCRGHFLPA